MLMSETETEIAIIEIQYWRLDVLQTLTSELNEDWTVDFFFAENVADLFAAGNRSDKVADVIATPVFHGRVWKKM